MSKEDVFYASVIIICISLLLPSELSINFLSFIGGFLAVIFTGLLYKDNTK